MLNRVRNPGGAADRFLQAEPLKALITSDPSRLESGLQIVDADLQAGAAGTIDLVGVDRSGALVLVHVAENADAGLLRLLDQYSWVRDQRQLLERLYAGRGLAPARPIRCLILARGFTHQFLDRLSLLRMEVTPCLVRPCGAGTAEHLTLEPAATVFGLSWSQPEDRGASRGAAAAPAGAAIEGSPWDVHEGLDLLEPGEAIPLDESPLEPAGLDLESAPEPAEPIESLTTEELEEFERFDRQRRQRDRSSP